MGNDSSTPSSEPTMRFINCSGEDMSVSNMYHTAQTVPKCDSSGCQSLSLPYDVVDYTITRSNGEIYTLIGNTITSLGYSTVFFWESIQMGSTLSSDKFCSANGTCTIGSNLSPGLHVLFSDEDVVAIMTLDKNNNSVLNSVSFSSVLTYTNPPPPAPPAPPSSISNLPPDDPSTTTDQPDSGSKHSFIKIFVILLLVLILLAVIIVAFVKIKNKHQNT